MSSYKEESPKPWTVVRTSSSFISSPPKKENDNNHTTTTPSTPSTSTTPISNINNFKQKESARNTDSTRISAISTRTKSIEMNISTASPPKARAMEEKKANGSGSGSISERIARREHSNGANLLKVNSASCIATTNYNYPVVNVNTKSEEQPQDPPSSTPEQPLNEDTTSKAQKRENLRIQRDNLNWDLSLFYQQNGNKAERKDSGGTWKPTPSRGADVEGLMTKVWDKQYKQAELYIAILGAELQTTRALTSTEVTIKMKRKLLATSPYGQEFCLEIDDKPEGDISVQIHTTNRFNQRKKMGRCTIVTSKLEDGKALETWYSFSKKKRKGSMKSRGYLKVKVMWVSAVTRNKDFLMAKENYTAITSLLLDQEGVIVSTLCKLYKEEDLAMSLIRLFNSQNQSSNLLMNLMIREIYFSDDPATLFRRDSMATKAARIFFSLVAKSYLKRMILYFVAYVTCDIGKGNSYEVDPTKLKSTDEITANAARLIVAAKRFLGPILDSSKDLPVSIRLFFFNLSSVLKCRVKTGNPVGALFFLRFVFPAVLFPSQYDLMDKPLDPPVFRAMVLVTKILQNLVNGCVFHEDYMTIFNSFITDNIASINAFFETLCTLPTPPNITYDDELSPYTEEQLVKLLSIIVRKLRIRTGGSAGYSSDTVDMFFEKIQPQMEVDPLYLTAKDKQAQLYLYAKLKTLFLERILTSETGDESEMKQT